jgi:hypothetical protein
MQLTDHPDRVVRHLPERCGYGPGLAEPTKKALATLDREWDGLIALRDYPARRLDPQQLLAVVPLVQCLGPIDALVALQSDERAGRQPRHQLGQLAYWAVTDTAMSSKPACRPAAPASSHREVGQRRPVQQAPPL